MTVTSLASQPTISGTDTRELPPPRSRFGRRVVGLFILSALVPLTLCAAILYGEFSRQLNQSARQSLDELVRSYGMTVLARLGNADDALKAILTSPAISDEEAQSAIAKLPWANGVKRVTPQEATEQQTLPALDRKQREALLNGQTSVLWHVDPHAGTEIYLVRALPSGTWLYVGLNRAWLWDGARDFAGDAVLLLTDDKGRILASTGSISADSAEVRGMSGPGRLKRSWELFLASRFSSPSWQLVASDETPALLSYGSSSYLYLCALIVFTILLVTWLSLSSIRRQLRPLDLLARATKRVAHRDFDAFRDLSWNDEFGDVAQAFRSMAGKLKMQFAALETLSDVDRLLLSTPRLELILDTLLPHVAEVLHCDCVSIVLFDANSEQSASVYDYYAALPRQLPVRRISCDTTAFQEVCASSCVTGSDASKWPCLAHMAEQGINRICLHPLKHDGSCVGVLCIGYVSEQAAMSGDSPVGAGDFADRLSLILTSLRHAERLRYQANFDSLTGLQNRHLFTDTVNAAVAMGAEKHTKGALLYIDLDLFKRVNDTAGHAAGDRLLQVVAERLRTCVGPGSSLARLGGDEFAVLVPSMEQSDAVAQMAQRIIASLEPVFVIRGREHRISASIGIAEFPGDGTTLEELLKAGDIAMYHAKEAGRGRAVFFRCEMQQKVLERERLERGLHRALANEELAVHYQPIADACSGKVAAEALVRWPSGEPGSWIPPSAFVPMAEESGLIVRLGEWVLRTACAQFSRWRRAGFELDYISVNVSVRQLREPDFTALLFSTLREAGMQGEQLQIEITESVLAHGTEVYQVLSNIAAAGVRLALDDFGTGYSSLSYVHAYPFHTVKIDRTFVDGLPGDVVSCRLAESIIVMCKALGMKVVAEGVETEAQREFLWGAGCTAIQGYLFARPMAAPAVEEFLEAAGYCHRRSYVDLKAAAR